MLFIKNQPVLTREGTIVYRNIHQIKHRGGRHTNLFAQYKGKLRQVEVGRHQGRKLFKLLC